MDLYISSKSKIWSIVIEPIHTLYKELLQRATFKLHMSFGDKQVYDFMQLYDIDIKFRL